MKQEIQGKRYLDIAREMDLLHISEHSPGVIFWHPAGFRMLALLRRMLEEVHEAHGYLQVKSPALVGSSLFVQSGHLDKFASNMFLVDQDKYAIRPMSCPNHIDIYRQGIKSYHDLPLPYFEFGEVCRNEPDGALQALFRCRAFCQDDSHVFVKKSDIQAQVGVFLQMAHAIYKQLGFPSVEVFISLRPEQRFGHDALWDEAENFLFSACQENKLPFQVIPGGGAFYGPKLELHIKDSLGRSWQLGVIQLDFVLPEKFELSYVGPANQPQRPAILHHAILGSLERFVGVILENYLQNNQWPLKVHPFPASLLGVSEKQNPYLLQVHQALKQQGLPVSLCLDSHPLSKKIAALKARHVPILLLAGPREESQNALSFQYQGIKEVLPVPEVMARLKELLAIKP